MGAQVEGIFRVGIAPLPASAVTVLLQSEDLHIPIGGSFHTEVLLVPMNFCHSKAPSIHVVGFHPTEAFFHPVSVSLLVDKQPEVPPFTGGCFFPKEALSSLRFGSVSAGASASPLLQA